MSRRIRRPSPVPKFIRLQWLPGNACRYTDKQWARLMAIAERTVRQDRQELHLPKYACDEYVRQG